MTNLMAKQPTVIQLNDFHHSSRTKVLQKKRIYIGSLSRSVTEVVLIELFGLNATKYLRNMCRVELPNNKQQD